MLRLHARTALLIVALGAPGYPLLAQSGTSTTAGSAASGRVLGTVVAVQGASVTLHPASGQNVVVTLTPQTKMLRTEPGAKTLQGATPIAASDLVVGDRVLIKLTQNSGSTPASAALLIAMTQADIAKANAEQLAGWEHNGVSGVVQLVDPATGTVVLRSQAGIPSLVIHTTPSTVVRHYSADSTAFADARPSTLAEVKSGDQLRARGTRTGDAVAAQEIVVGSFRDVAGVVRSTDPASGTITLTELATKKPITLHVNAETKLRMLPPWMAARLASRHAGAEQHANSEEHTAPGVQPHEPGHGGNTAELLERAPAIQLSDLKKGDAVMIVASGPGAPQPTAITVVAGVEPLLQAPPEASAGVFSASWNLGGGADAAAEGGAPER